MNGMDLKPNRRSRWRHPLFWVVLVVCLLATSVPVSANNMFSLVYPQATGDKVLKKGSAVVDISNASQGYIMVKYQPTNKKLKVQLTYGETTLNLDLNGQGEYDTYPLYGSGTYKIAVLEQVKGNQYSAKLQDKFKADITDPNSAFLIPNQYVWYTPTSTAVVKSFELCNNLETDLEKAQALYNFVGTNVVYDHMKALTIQGGGMAGYLPDVDETYKTKMGICFDYSALLGCMMRVQGIPTRLIIGNLLPLPQGQQYHAWNTALVDGNWVLMDSTFYNQGYKQTDYAMEKYF